MENNKLNFFFTPEAMKALLEKHSGNGRLGENEIFTECGFTVDIIAAPHRLYYHANSEKAELILDRRGLLYETEEKETYRLATSFLNLKGEVRGRLPDDLQDTMRIYLMFCLNLAVYLRRHGIFELYPDLNPETQGILVEENGNKLEMKPVAGDERPDLVCTMLSGELKLMRPYKADIMRDAILDVMPIEKKEAAAESGDIKMMRYLFDYYMGNNESAHRDLEKNARKMMIAMNELSGNQHDIKEEEDEEEDTRDPEKAFYWLKKLAENGYGGAYQLLSTFYAKGFGTKRNFEEAAKIAEKLPEDIKSQQPIDLYKQSAELQKRLESGDPRVLNQYAFNLTMLGKMNPNIGQDTDYAEAFQLVQKSAAQNDPEGIDFLSKYYEFGIGVPKDEKKAFRLCERAAERGYVVSQEKLARMYFDGIGTEKNTDAALEWAKKAADQGDIPAMKTLIRIYINKEGGRDDLAEAEVWARKAASLGDEEAKTFLQNLNEAKEGRLVSFREALADAERGNPAAQCLVGSYYACAYQTERNLGQALYWMRKAAASGRSDAQAFVDGFTNIEEIERKAAEGDAQAIGELAQKYIALSNAYSYEREKTISEGLAYAQRAAGMGNALGQFVLGHCYENGIGLETDSKKAIELYTLSAEQECFLAELALANLCLVGKGTDIDPDAAVAWLEKAEEHGAPEAAKTKTMYPQIMFGIGADKLGNGAKTGGPDPDLGFRLVKKAAELGHGEAQGALGMFYLNGNHVEQDFENGISWLKKAAENGVRQVVDAVAKYDRPEAYNSAANKELMRKDRAPDKEKVFRLMKHAAESGLAASQSTLGLLYMNGIGTAPDYNQGMEWYQKAADQGNEKALSSLQKYRLPEEMYKVAFIMLVYNKKNGIDSAEALTLLKKAAAAGSAEAYNLIGLFNAAPQNAEEKFGVVAVKDLEKAKRFFEKALEIKPNLVQADNNLKKLAAEEQSELHGTPVPPDLRWAFVLPFKKKASSNENDRVSDTGSKEVL